MSETRPRPPHFGEEDRELSYGSYLKVPELLSLQHFLSDPPAHDELLFIIVHQTYELWFKQLLFELTSARDLMMDGDAHQPKNLLERAHSIERVMIAQIPVIESMSPQDFLEFRQHLAPASGFQSVQFREVEFLSGINLDGISSAEASVEADTSELRARLEVGFGD